jgi:hypothetical protein
VDYLHAFRLFHRANQYVPALQIGQGSQIHPVQVQVVEAEEYALRRFCFARGHSLVDPLLRCDDEEAMYRAALASHRPGRRGRQAQGLALRARHPVCGLAENQAASDRQIPDRRVFAEPMVGHFGMRRSRRLGDD